MQTVSTAYRNAYDKAYTLRALPRVLIEWSHNRFHPTVTASNGGDTTDDPNFPITSIVHSVRGRAGLVKGRVGEARTYRSKENDAPQYRTVGPDSIYKYWTSPNQSGTGGAITNVRPQVIYGAAVRTNKLIIATEPTFAKATVWQVAITTNGTTWTTVAANTNSTMDANGLITLYLQDGGTWRGTYNINNSTLIRGVRFTVTTMSAESVHFNLIELSANYVRDYSDYVIDADVSASTSDVSLVFPVGNITSNTATVTLDNTNELFDRGNTASELFGLIDTNAKVGVYFGTDTSQFGGVMEYVPQGVFYVDSWADNVEASTVSLECSDFSKFFQEMKVTPTLYINRTAGQIIAEVLSTVGFRNYTIDIANNENQPKIPYVWFTGEETVWEALQSICASTQGTIYSDEGGIMRYVSRDKTFENANDDPDYIITAEDSADRLANLQNISYNFEVEANKAVINYRPIRANSSKVPVDKTITIGEQMGPWKNSVTRTRVVREYDEKPIESVLWKPEGTVILQAADLTKTMEAADTEFTVLERNAVFWPWKATVNIEGEILSYDGKEYRYWKNGVEQKVIVKSQEEETRIKDLVGDLATAHKNSYTGRFVNVTRALWGSKAARHVVGLNDWTAYRRNSNNTIDHTPSRIYVRESHMVLQGFAGDTGDTYTMAMRPFSSEAFQVFGTRMRFANVAFKQGTAGLFFHMQADRVAGYFVEVNLSEWASVGTGGAINEIRVYRRNSNGTTSAVSGVMEDPRGITFPVVRNNWYDVEVVKTGNSNSLYLNGQLMYTFTDPAGSLAAGHWGTFVRGHSVAEFEYNYVSNNADNSEPALDESSFHHKVTGSYVSGYADREISRNPAGRTNWYFADFGPWVHEMREFDVDFDKAPALDANVFMSNDWDAYIIEGNRTPFSAKFWIANSGRTNATLSGDDPGMYVGGGNAQQQIMVYGQLITEDEEESVTTTTEEENLVTYSNEYAIRKRGTVELSVDSNWIQSKSQAEELGKWITDHWSEPVDNVTVTGYFSPAVQLGDLVTVSHTARNVSATDHRYHIVGKSVNFSEGLDVSLTLRRVR